MDFKKAIPENDMIQWVEYYRPLTFNDILLPKDLKKYFKNIIKSGNIPHLVMHSRNPGSGKTSLAKILCNDLDYEYRYFNISKTTGIDVLRTNITKFAQAKSLFGKMKAVILDEADGATPELMKALKADIEIYHNKCRFILLTNEIDLINDKVLSRCQRADMNYNTEVEYNEMIGLVAERVSKILDHRKVGYDEEALADLIIKYFPDIRNIINICDEYNTKFGYINTNILKFHELSDEFFGYIKSNDLTKARKYLAKINYNYLNIFTDIDRFYQNKLTKSQECNAILVNCDYQSIMHNAINKEIVAAGFIQEMIKIVCQ